MECRTANWRRYCLAAVLAVGAGGAWAVGAVWSYAIIGGIALQLFPSLRHNETRPVRNTVILRDGTPLVAESRQGSPTTYSTLDGKPHASVSDEEKLSGTILQGPVVDDRFRGLTWGERLTRFEPFLGSPGTVWYFVHDGQLDGSGYFVGYDAAAKLPVQYVGRNGFVAEEPADEARFRVDGRRIADNRAFFRGNPKADFRPHQVGLFTRDGLIDINMKDRTAKTLCAEPDIVSATTADDSARIGVRSEKNAIGWGDILVRTADQVLVFDLTGKLLRSYPLPEALRGLELTWYEAPGADALVWVPFGAKLYWLDASGKIVRRESVDLSVPQPQQSKTLRNVNELAAGMAFSSPGTLAGTRLWRYLYWRPLPAPYDVIDAWPVFAGMLLVSTILALLTLRRHRKYGLTWTWLWVGSVLVFGIPAYLGYLVHRTWPARLACPHCGRLAPRDRDACFACGQGFPEPALKGTEIFA